MSDTVLRRQTWEALSSFEREWNRYAGPRVASETFARSVLRPTGSGVVVDTVNDVREVISARGLGGDPGYYEEALDRIRRGRRDPDDVFILNTLGRRLDGMPTGPDDFGRTPSPEDQIARRELQKLIDALAEESKAYEAKGWFAKRWSDFMDLIG